MDADPQALAEHAHRINNIRRFTATGTPPRRIGRTATATLNPTPWKHFHVDIVTPKRRLLHVPTGAMTWNGMIAMLDRGITSGVSQPLFVMWRSTYATATNLGLSQLCASVGEASASTITPPRTSRSSSYSGHTQTSRHAHRKHDDVT